MDQSTADGTNLNTIPPNCLILVCEFMGPGSIFILGRVSKPLYDFTRSPSDLVQLSRVFNLPASTSLWNDQFRHRVSVRSEYPACPESTLELDSSLTPNSIRLGSFPLFRPFKTFETFSFCEAFGVLRKEKLMIFNDKLELIWQQDWTHPVLNSTCQGRASPYLCSVQDRSTKFIEPKTGDTVYSIDRQDAKLYSEGYLLTAEKSSISLIKIDFEAQQHHTLWTKPFELHKDSEFRLRDDYILHFRESELIVYELTMLDAKTGDVLWHKTISGIKIQVSLSFSLVTVWNIHGNGLQIRHFDYESGAVYEKDFKQTGHIFRPGGYVTKPVLIGDGFIVAAVPFIRSDYRLVVVDFFNGTISKQVIDDVNSHRLGIAFRDIPFAPVKVKLLNLAELNPVIPCQSDPSIRKD